MDQFWRKCISFWWNKSVLGETDQFLVERISFWRNGSGFGETKKLLSGRNHILVKRISCWWNGSILGHESMINLKDLFKSSLLALYNSFGELLPSAKHRL